MPLKRKLAAPAPEPSGFGLKNLLAGLVRAGSGYAAGFPSMVPGPGTAIGAGIAGAGEAGAEWIEGSEPSLKRIAAEAALGAIPLGAIFKAGKFIPSVIRGGIFSGAGEAMREAAREEEFSPTNIGLAAGTGGLLTGGLSKLIRAPAPTTKAIKEFTVVPTAQTGPGTGILVGGKITAGKGGVTTLKGAKRAEIQAPKSIPS